MKTLLTLPAPPRRAAVRGGPRRKQSDVMPELLQMWPLLVTSVAIYYFYRWVVTDMNGR